jgi:hypothetical protein
MTKHLRVLLLVLLVAACAGTSCRRPARTTVPKAPLTKVEYFKQTQSATMTPHGSIVMDSVKETPDGVEYKTSDGSSWRVVVERTADGYRVHGSPEAVK